MDLRDVEETCLAAFRRHDYLECALIAMRRSKRFTSHTLLQLNVICFQRVGYPGVESMGDLAIDILKGDPWHCALIELTLGRRAFSDVLALARDSAMRCQAYYYAGARILSDLLREEVVNPTTAKRVRTACHAFLKAREAAVQCIEFELAGIEAASLNCQLEEKMSRLDELIDEEFIDA